jgi:DNA-binding NarL/FixJ family response regulator
LTPQQRQVIQLKKVGKDNEVIAQVLNLKNHQLMAEWSKLYLTAQALRSQGQ